MELGDTTYDRKDSQHTLGLPPDPVLDTIENPELEPNSMVQTSTTDQALVNDDWTLPIRSIGPVSASAPGKQTKKSKKKQKIVSSDQQAPEDVKWGW